MKSSLDTILSKCTFGMYFVCTRKSLYSLLSMYLLSTTYTFTLAGNIITMVDFFYETLQKKDSERCMFIV